MQEDYTIMKLAKHKPLNSLLMEKLRLLWVVLKEKT